MRGLGPILLSVPDLPPTDALLREALHMRPVREYLHPDNPAHGVHHVAFRTPTFEEHAAWIERIGGLGIPHSGLVDRYYFRSLYFREPNGILFEIASDGPGFTVDEEESRLGEKVTLPPFLEPRRAAIVAGLKPID